MKTYECAECGEVNRSKVWPNCSRHKSLGMYQVVDWGKNGAPKVLATEVNEILPIEK